ncbi:mannose-6-phosphate isomerase [Spinactinospora alkalitolerans]|uniref:mannose-6-phosphate isomerase n=1 Tax=Spinactinospora alkalitolerans TaxID=687207 RepID=A0A852U0H5_9ACTN|nr:mannose-6-phosphate isomerase [Spinactinospora alkalitolerans]
MANQIRPYAWGSTTSIPDRLGVAPDGRPQAELWMGAHPGAPSRIEAEAGPVALDAAIAGDPKEMLGEDVVLHFGERLPFLLKLLAAEQPLSLQVHPSAARARAGYAAENAAGVPLDAPHRNYKDPFHKPELVLALDAFEALCGFRDPALARAELDGLASPLAVALRTDLAAPEPHSALRAAMTRLLTLPPERRTAEVDGFVGELAELPVDAVPDGGGAAVVLELAERYPGDPGAVAALLLNHVTLAPGEALFLPAGNVHAYLRGTAVEIMAGSDNVLRAGLTPKHVDADELLDVVEFAVLPVPYAVPDLCDGRIEHRPDVADFALSIITPDAAEGPGPRGPAIVFVLEGEAGLRSESGRGLVLGRGESAFVPASCGEVTLTGPARVVAATTGRI